jgi:DnaK suppressor protein
MNNIGLGRFKYARSNQGSYLNETQLFYLETKLIAWRQVLTIELSKTKSFLKTNTRQIGDELERATLEEEINFQLKARERECKLIKRIEETINKLRNHDFGYCKACGVEIGFDRLKVRPVADRCRDCKEFAEIKEKQQRGH